MANQPEHSLHDLYNELKKDPEFLKADRRVRPYTDLVVQIIKRRAQLGLTQKDLAQLAGTHQSRISKIESGEHDITLSTLIDIAEALKAEVYIQLVPISEEQDHARVVIHNQINYP